MLAAILCNLSGTPPPPPPPPVVVQPSFGGGPFWKRYGYGCDDDEVIAQEAREALPGPKAEKAEAALSRAVEAIRNDEPQIVLDAQRIYERVFLSLGGELRAQMREIIHAAVEKERIDELWRAEIQRRMQEREEEEFAVVLLCL